VSSRNYSSMRVMLGIALPTLTMCATLLPLWLRRERLPEPLATHWGLDGAPNGAMPLLLLTAILGTLAGIAAAGLAVISRRRQEQHGEVSTSLAMAGFVAGSIAAVSWLTVSANLDASSWREAQSIGLGAVAMTLLAGFGLAAALSQAARLLVSTSTRTDVSLPRAGLALGDRAVWVGSASATWATYSVFGGFAVAIIMSQINLSAAFAAAVLGIACLFFTSIRVTADRNGIQIAYGMLHWPVQRVGLAEIHRATILQIEPMAWGGWGYRGSLRMTRRAAVVLRRGKGLKLELSGDRVFAITVDNAEEGASVLNDLVAGQGLAPGRIAGRD
jgi:hypothetical protein